MTSDTTGAPSCITPQYLAGFHCIASACEEDCCHGWQITIDHKTFKKMKNAMDRSKEDRERFRQFFKRNRSGDKVEASIVLRPDGTCPFLNDEKLCDIHRQFGSSYLSMICGSYPRKKTQVGNRTELVALLSCPEVARRCLLDPLAMELVDIKPGSLDRDAICTHIHPLATKDPYLAHLDEVRQVILNLLSMSRFPLASRLFFIACFADNVSPRFHKKTTSFSPDDLADEIDLLANVDTLNELHFQFEQIDNRIDFAMALVQQILTARLKKIPKDFVTLLEQTWDNYNLLSKTALTSGQESEAPENRPDILEEAQSIYQQRRALLQTTFSERIDQYFGNYAMNYWFSEWYTDSPNLVEHALKLFIRLAILRFLFFSHPGLNALVEQVSEGELDLAELESSQAILDKIAVETVYRFSRGIEHDTVYLKEIQQTLAGKGLENLALLTLLLKF